MATITIESAPRAFHIPYSECILIEKNNLRSGLHQLTQAFFHEESQSYGPFEDDDALTFLKLWDYEDRLS